MATVEELTGLLKGLADVVKSQQQANYGTITKFILHC